MMRTLMVMAMMLTLAGVAPAGAQRFGGGRNSTEVNNVAYDGRFVYARLQYTPASFNGFGRGDPMWNHDYPRADRTFPQILAELTSVKARYDASNVFAADDPELMKFPMVYLCEVGAWRPTEAEVLGLRRYMMKGGFVLVDDFDGPDWYNFTEQLERVLPGANPIRLDASHPIFDSFYRIDELPTEDITTPYTPEFYAVFEDNDPEKRVMMIINYNFDISEFWEFAATGRAPIVSTNNAFKLGINYLMYTLTH
jgi:hypothetical protein